MARVRSKIMVAAGVSLAVAIGVTGCGQVQKLSAKDSVSDALSNFESAKSATFTVSIDSTMADVAAISAAEGDPMSKSDQKSFAQVLAGDVVFAVQAPDGKTFGDAAKAGASTTGSADLQTLLSDPSKLSQLLKEQGAFSMTVRLSGDALVDLRSLDGKIYARANAKKILSLAGEDPDSLDQELAGLPPALSPLARAAKGEWVSIDLAKAAAAAKDSGMLNALPTATASPAVDAAKVQKLMSDLRRAYQQKATITELGETSERGQGYRLGAPAKQVAEAVSDDLVALAGPTSAKEVRKAITQIPDKTFNLDLWVKDKKLSAVSLDITQFLPKPVEGRKLALDIDVKPDSANVTAPSGATEIDVKKLLSDFPGAALGGAGLSSGSGSGLGGPKLTDDQIKILKQSGMSEKQIKDLMKAQSGQ